MCRISFYWVSGLDRKSLKIREGAHGLSPAAENKPPPLAVRPVTDLVRVPSSLKPFACSSERIYSKKTNYKELAHMILESGNSQDVQGL